MSRLSITAFAAFFLAGPVAANSSLQANLGPLPVDLYLARNSQPGGLVVPNCPASYAVRACIQTQLASFHRQNVTGLRFMFGIGGGGNSTAITPDGTLRPAWVQNLRLFLADVKASGIPAVTPTPVWGAWGGDFSVRRTVFDGCQQRLVTYTFFPAQPFGSLTTNFYPADGGMNAAYTCSPANPIFVGWRKLYAMLDQVLGAVQQSGLAMTELDIVNEINLSWFTVTARMIYDNTDSQTPRDADVLGNIRQLLAKHGFSPGAATYSVGATSTSAAGWTCPDAWSDSARLDMLDALWGAFAGPHSAFGHPPDLWKRFRHGLACDPAGLQTPVMVQLPISHTPPSIIDVHDYTDVQTASPTGAPTNQPDLTTPDASEIADTTALDNGLAAFMRRHNVAGDTIIFGETYSADNAYGPKPKNIIPDKLQAYAASGLSTHKVIFRPWGDILDPNYAFPENLTDFTTK
jgi:hypothetical protein